MEKRGRGRIRNILIFMFLILLFIGMTAMSFVLLYRYAEYGKEASVNTAGPENAGKDKKTEKTSEKMSDRKDFSLKKLEPGKKIRVQLLGNGYTTQYHETLTVTAESDIAVSCGGKRQVIPAGELLQVFCAEKMPEESLSRKLSSKEQGTEDCQDKSSRIGLWADQMLVIEAEDETCPLTLPELERGQESPSYEGKIEVYGTEEGLLAVNEVGLETYLKSVVSSEMPSSYPMQALCAQAVCARTYAFNCMKQAKDRKKTADLDDSVACQVYNNYPGDELSAQAVRMTEGLIMDCGDVYYYSTSCLTEERTDLDKEENFREFLDTAPEKEAEYGSLWVRWSAELPKEHILSKLQELYGCRWEKLQQVKVLKRNSNGQAQSLVLSDGSGKITVDGEYQIRCVLGCAGIKIRLADGSAAENLQLLPSAYFYIQKNGKNPDTVFIRGGGYGHGIGMSQNGAAAMAREGAGYEEILKYYYS